MPHMSVRDGRICGVPTRLFRVSFTGELGFEVNVPAGFRSRGLGGDLRRRAPYGITPYGTEAMHVLRAEKGYIIVGQETDGTVTPDDAGLGWAVGKNKPDFVGKRSLARPRRREATASNWSACHGRSENGLGRGGADRRRPSRTNSNDHDRPRDFVLLERHARSFDRPRLGPRRTRADRNTTFGADAGWLDCGRSRSTRVL